MKIVVVTRSEYRIILSREASSVKWLMKGVDYVICHDRVAPSDRILERLVSWSIFET